MFLALLTLSLLGDVAPPRPMKQPAPQCRSDDECVLSTFDGCCGSCCASAPHAVRKGVNESEAAHCAVIDCALPECSAVKCRQAPDPSQFVPACRGGRCVAVPKGEAPAQCRADGDCRVVAAAPPAGDACHRSACGCCPVTQAVPADAVVPLQQQRPDSKAPATKPNFGLSTGKPNGPPAPNCSPCPAPASGVAVCQAGRCVLGQPMPRPRPMPPG